MGAVKIRQKEESKNKNRHKITFHPQKDGVQNKLTNSITFNIDTMPPKTHKIHLVEV